MKEPFLYNGTAPITVNADMVFGIVKTITAAGKEEEFLALCRERNISIEASPELVNLVKSHLFSTRQVQWSDFADNVIRSATCPKDG